MKMTQVILQQNIKDDEKANVNYFQIIPAS